MASFRPATPDLGPQPRRSAATQYPLRMAAAVIMTIPIAILFLVFQKYILRTGEGAVKE